MQRNKIQQFLRIPTNLFSCNSCYQSSIAPVVPSYSTVNSVDHKIIYITFCQLIGVRAERLAWIFCTVDRATVDKTLYKNEHEKDKNDISEEICKDLKYEFYSREELGRFPLPLTGMNLN